MKKYICLLVMFSCFLVSSAQTVVLQEDFEQATYNVVASGATYNWSINTRLHYSGIKCDSNIVSLNDTAYLTTVPFTTVGYTSVLLRFSHICKIELLDAGEIEVSVNNGPWIKLTGDHYINPGNSQFENNGNKFNTNTYPLNWQPAINGVMPTQSWWKNEIFNISAIAANSSNVRIRFLLRDGNSNGSSTCHGWYIDNISVTASADEIIPPKITVIPVIIQDTVFNTGPFDIYAHITDSSGIDTAYIVYKLNNGTEMVEPMIWISDSTYKGTIPSYTYTNKIDYHVRAFDNSTAHVQADGLSFWFYIKKIIPLVEIGNGTTQQAWPYATLYEDARTQLIYASNEITAADGVAGPITSIAFNVASASAITMNNFNIKMQHTSLSNLSGFVNTGWATVYSGTYTVTNTGWQTITLQTPFNWDGNSNLLIDICYDNTFTSSNSQVYCTPASGKTWTQYVNGSSGCTLGGGSVQTNRPNIQLHLPTFTYTADAGINQIISPAGTILSGVNNPVYIRIKNYADDTLTKVKIAWQLDGISQAIFHWTGQLAEDVISGVFSIGDINVLPGSHTIKVWTELPNDNADQFHSNDTLNVNFYACSSYLNGTYTIGAGCNYADFNSALASLNNCGINGQVIFNVLPGIYNEQINIPEIPGASSLHTITFQSASGNYNDVTLAYSASGTANNFVVNLNGADYIHFKNLTIQANGNVYSNVIKYSNNATYNSFIGNRLLGTASNTTTIDKAVIISPSGALTCDSVMLFEENIIENGSYGIYCYGQGSAINQLENKTIIKNNQFINQYYSGIYLYYQNAPEVTQNTFSTNNTYTTFYSIYCGYCDNQLKILKNKISQSNGGYGIYLSYCDGAYDKEGLIANNMISISGINSTYGIYPYYCSNQKIYYNSVNIYSNNSTACAFYLSGSTSNINHYLKNNIFAYTGTNLSGLAVYIANTAGVASMNYNDLYSSGTNLGYWTAMQPNLAAWKTVSSKDSNSVSVNPYFISPADLHTYSSQINDHAISVAGVSDDIDGNLRDAVTPDIGASEFDVPEKNIGILYVIEPVNSCGATSPGNVVIRLKNFGSTHITSADVYYAINGGTAIHETMTYSLLPEAEYNYTFTQQADLTAPGNYSFKFWVNLSGDTIPLNDTISNYIVYSGYDFNSGYFTIGFEASENFSDWLVVDVNGDNYGWTIPYTSASDAHTGSNSARLYNANNAGNDWLFSRCFTLNAGATYKIEFWYRAYNSSYPQTIDLKAGNTATPGAMVSNLLTLTSFNNTSYQKATAYFIPANSGSYYFGWWGHSVASSYYAFVDDINISLVPLQEAALLSVTAPISGCGLTSAETVSILIKNTGTNEINGNYNASYTFNNGTPVTEVLTSSIAPNDTLSFSFTQTVDAHVVANDSIFPLKVWVSLLNDPYSFNDTINSPIASSHIPADPLTISDTTAYGEPATLIASSSDFIYWFDVPTGGNVIFSGDTLITPPLFVNTVYYAQSITQGGTNSWTFDSGLEGWTVQNPCSSTVEWSWNSDGGNGTLYASNPAATSSQLITSPSVIVAGAETVSLSFTHRYQTESCCDEGYVAYRLDNGPWTQFFPTTNTYSTSTHSVDMDPLNSCTSNSKSCFYGAQSAYITSSGSINTTGATNIQLAFVYTTDLSVGSDGWYINDVVLSGGMGGCTSNRIPDTAYVELLPFEASLTDINSPVSSCAGSFENISIRIRNNGLNTINGNFTAHYKVNSGPVVSEAILDVIVPGDTISFTFSTPFTTGLSQSYQDSAFQIITYIELSGDTYTLNDTLSKTVDLLYTPPNPVTTNIFVPYGTSGTFNIISTDSLYWFDVPVGGTEIAQGNSYTTPVLFGTTFYYVESRSGTPDVKLTEITHFSTGTGYTNPYPAWCTGADLIEISNLGTSPINLGNYTMNIYGVGNRSYVIPDITLEAGEILVLCAGTGIDDPANKYYNMGGGNDIIQSTSLSGFALKTPNGEVVDAVASNGYIFTISDGVSAGDWSGNINGMSSYAGTIRMISDNNISGDWIISSAIVPQTIGTLNPNLSVSYNGSGCASARVPDTAYVTGVPPCDMSVLDIYSPESAIELGSAEIITVKVKNYGTQTAVNIPITYNINETTIINDTIPGPIAQNDTTIFSFAVPADLSAYGTYQIKVYTKLNCDTTFINDTASKTVICSQIPYCNSNAIYTTGSNIGNITFGTLNNGNPFPVLSNPNSTHAYSDYTGLPATPITIGSDYPISISQIEYSATFYSAAVKVYIDYNRNGQFDIPSELAFNAVTVNATNPSVTGNITIPVTGTVTGLPTRMRVVLDRSGNAPPCGTYSYGETEDYFLYILPQIPHDAGVTAIISPENTEIEDSLVPVEVIICNFGTDTIRNSSNMTVSYTYNGLPPQSITWSGGDILPLHSDTAVLPGISISPNMNHICATTSLPGDSNVFNDEFCKDFYGTPLNDAGIVAILHPGAESVSDADEVVSVVVKNFGVQNLTSLNLCYNINGILSATQAWSGTIAPNNMDTITITQTFNIPQTAFTLCAYTSFDADSNHANDTVCMNSFGVVTSTIPYFDNFDDSTVFWSQVSAAGSVWELGQPAYGSTNSAFTPPNSWDINLSDPYGGDANSILYTQFFDFSNAVDVKMKFWFNIYCESSWDGLRVDYSTDTNKTWYVLGSVSAPGSYFWYNNSSLYSSNLPGWTGNSLVWRYCWFQLSQLNHVPLVRFRFVFTSDPSVNYDGVSVDNFSISKQGMKDVGVELISSPSVQAQAGSSRQVKVRLRNYGLSSAISVPIAYRINDDGPVITQTWTGVLPPYDSISVIFTTPFTVPEGKFKIISYTQLAGDGDYENDTTYSYVMGVPKYNVPYSDDFENTPYWVGTGVPNIWEYGTPASTNINTPYSPSNAWKTKLNTTYPNNATSYLYSPWFYLAYVDSAYLEFRHWYHTQDSYDGCLIEYTVNNGNSWTVLGTQNDSHATDWYNALINGIPCWSGNSSGYTYSRYALAYVTPIMNATGYVQFRYKFFSNNTINNYDGWALDNFSITVPPIPKDAGVTDIALPDDSVQTGSEVTVKLTIHNFGTDSLQMIPVRYFISGGAVVAETWHGTLLSGESTDYTFTTTYPSPGTAYQICAFTKRTGDIYWGNDTTCKFINPTPANHDVGISEILEPGEYTPPGEDVTVKVRIKNYGLNPEASIPLVYLKNLIQVGAGIYTGTINPGDSADYTFTTTFISPTGNYNLCAKTMLTGDEDPVNDEKCIFPFGGTGMEEYKNKDFELLQNIPNPATEVTTIIYKTLQSGRVIFEITDILGRKIFSELYDAISGINTIELNVSEFPAGLYYYSVIYKDNKLCKRMIILK